MGETSEWTGYWRSLDVKNIPPPECLYTVYMLGPFQHRLKMYHNFRKPPPGAFVFCCKTIMAIVLNFGITVLEGLLSLTVANKTQILYYF